MKQGMEKKGLKSAHTDPNLFIWNNPESGSKAYVLVYVDNMLIIGTRADVNILKNHILVTWKGKYLGAVDTFSGLQIERDRKARTLRIHQSNYTEKLLLKFGMANAKGSDLPATAGTVLRKLGTDEEINHEW